MSLVLLAPGRAELANRGREGRSLALLVPELKPGGLWFERGFAGCWCLANT